MYVRSRFLTRRGVLELATSIEACMLSWLEGGCLSTPSTPPVSAPEYSTHAQIEAIAEATPLMVATPNFTDFSADYVLRCVYSAGTGTAL